MKVRITIDIDDQYADPAHPMGVTDEGYTRIVDTLSWLGDDVDVERADAALD